MGYLYPDLVRSCEHRPKRKLERVQKLLQLVLSDKARARRIEVVPISYALCLIPYALCHMPYALYHMPYAICLMPYAICFEPYALYLMPYPYALSLMLPSQIEVGPIPYALCIMPYPCVLCLMPIRIGVIPLQLVVTHSFSRDHNRFLQ